MSITVAAIELMFCMCGPLERKCSYCGKHFQEGHHGGIGGVGGTMIMLQNGRPIYDEHIKCIFCGNLTFPKDRVKRPAKEIKAERRG